MVYTRCIPSKCLSYTIDILNSIELLLKRSPSSARWIVYLGSNHCMHTCIQYTFSQKTNSCHIPSIYQDYKGWKYIPSIYQVYTISKLSGVSRWWLTESLSRHRDGGQLEVVAAPAQDARADIRLLNCRYDCRVLLWAEKLGASLWAAGPAIMLLPTSSWTWSDYYRLGCHGGQLVAESESRCQ